MRRLVGPRETCDQCGRGVSLCETAARLVVLDGREAVEEDIAVAGNISSLSDRQCAARLPCCAWLSSWIFG